MKKVIGFMCLAVIVILVIINIKPEKIDENNIQDVKINILVQNITSTTASIKVDNNETLKYELKINDEVIKTGVFLKEINFADLTDDTEYIFNVIYNDRVFTKKIHTIKNTVLRFGGDVMMTSYFADYIARYGVDYMWKDVSDLFNTADYAFVNLETSVSERGESNKPIGYGFRSHPSSLQGLVNSGIDFVSVANNHVFDYGELAFYDTLSNLEKYNIKYTGAGANKEEAAKIHYEQINDLKISFISATRVLGNTRWEAGTNKVGVLALKEHNYEFIKEKIKEAKDNSDYVILNLHWGIEYDNYPVNDQISLAHEFIDSGADIIVGHHPHVLQGVEYYKNGIIFYSIGNFNFLITDKNTSSTGVFELNLNKDGIVSSKIYPVRINSCKANLLKKDELIYNDIINNLNERSKLFNTFVTFEGDIISNDKR